MRGAVMLLLSILTFSGQANAERSYLMIPGAVEQAESMGEAAGKVGQSSFRTPRTAGEAMGRLRHIDHDLSKIIHLASRFQATSRLLDKGIHDLHRFAAHNRRLIQEWSPALQGNYRIIHTVFIETGRKDIRILTTLMILENMIASLDARTTSLQQIRSIELKYSLEAQTIAAARERIHGQLLLVKQELKGIRNKARSM